MTMTVNEMLEKLQDEVEAGRGEYELRIAYQPTYPLRAEVANVVASDDMDEDEDGNYEADCFVWIAATASVAGYDESPYAPSTAWSDGGGW